jgi:ADP-ribose pyrophosphatase YjhB (NUDIX family)
MPERVGSIPIETWMNAPDTPADWSALAGEQPVREPDFQGKPGYARAAGVVVREPDGRVWLVAPSNAFGGYQATFPKGTLTDGLSAQATALKEAYEESGLKVRLLKHLIDVTRTRSVSRYYLAERTGGNPADMDWESQAVLLVPPDQLLAQLNSPYDHAIVAALGKA